MTIAYEDHRSELQAEVMALLRRGLKDGPDYERDWASWEEFAGELLSLVTGAESHEVMQVVYYLTGMRETTGEDVKALDAAWKTLAPCPF